jgi:putative transposase
LVRKRESGIWQRRYWEHTIRGDQDYAVHMDYVHFNPVKHGLAADPADWPFSSFVACAKLGMYPIDWAKPGAELADAGERL